MVMSKEQWSQLEGTPDLHWDKFIIKKNNNYTELKHMIHKNLWLQIDTKKIEWHSTFQGIIYYFEER